MDFFNGFEFDFATLRAWEGSVLCDGQNAPMSNFFTVSGVVYTLSLPFNCRNKISLQMGKADVLQKFGVWISHMEKERLPGLSLRLETLQIEWW